MDSKFANGHPRWDALLLWLTTHGMRGADLLVESRSSPGAGYGLFATRDLQPSTLLFSIPAKALMNSLTLSPNYPSSQPRLTCTQIVSLHLLLHRPLTNQSHSDDPLFGPYISVLPREFDSHPLTWLWKEDNYHGPAVVPSSETRLLNALPISAIAKLNKIFGLFKSDWDRVQRYLEEHPTLGMRFDKNLAHLEASYLWAWLNVNTRSIYHRLTKARSSPENMTLCPVLDFANHTFTNLSAYPRSTEVNIADSRISSEAKKFGEKKFVLLSPSGTSILSGEEIFLRYGMHSNSTLFTEYGFLNVVDWNDLPEGFSAEVSMDAYIEPLFEQKGGVGQWMKNVLQDGGYWGDWSMQISPSPAHPCYRLITALRLVCVLPAATNELPITECNRIIEKWRNTTLGNQETISSENESEWRACLLRICNVVVAKAEEGLSKLAQLRIEEEFSYNWLVPMSYIEMLWREEAHVATEVIASLQGNIAF